MDHSASAASIGRFLTIGDTAAVLNVSVSKVYSLVRSGELPAIRIGARGQWRIERIHLESYIETQYEAARRVGQWNQTEFANVVELAFGPDYIRTSSN